ncbi:hypothetical protein AR437_05405 [Christensenella hongkongensis]|uniref:Nif3-like dinuclear metal center hexameric protein n=1 Tax=Christensenella hongkongensis TaxID=270498 RepID=UPI00073FDD87|nr:Nif3-like dinuclear metal center hexameric protein [Christensenella hongkongensis]KUJ31627.1 hypothetical protein AR437_05405 [Christensenella hongkongensis]
MSVTLEQVGALIEKMAPQKFAEDWDNTGFNLNLHNRDITGIYICLDVTQEAIRDAADKKCNLIISHHPLLFRAVKRLDNAEYEGKCIQLLMREGISLYCAHTSIDRAPKGINSWLADIFNLGNRRYLSDEIREPYYEVAVHVPQEQAAQVRDAMTAAGAGRLGDYSDCTYSIEGNGTFRPDANAHPFIGTANQMETVKEIRISSICKKSRLVGVIAAIRSAHPYEEPAISVLTTEEPVGIEAGLGVVGDLPAKMTAKKALDILKKALHTDSVRVAGDLESEVGRIAVCGGAAGEFADAAKEKGAQMYITGEIKHNFYAARNGIILVEAGHFDTEKCFCEGYAQGLQNLLNDVNYNIAIYVENLRRPYVNY